MSETIKIILSLSLSGSILVALIFILKIFVKQKLPKSIQYYVWIVVLLRFIIPFSFEGSIMNSVFYNDKISTEINSQSVTKSSADTSKNIINSPTLNNVQQNNMVKADFSYSRYLINLFNQYAIFIWLLGVIIILKVNLNGYLKFLESIRSSNKPATDEQNRILNTLINRSCNVKLVRNHFVTTPMLIGILKPYIIIPDIDFDEKQLKNIFLHELSHLRRFDILIKWLTLICTTIHWFNPLMYFIRKEINHACELACDEAVIKNLNLEEKQSYGDTLISIVSEHKYPVKILQATMCEEKKSLKERLIAIMNHNKKSKFITVISILLMVVAITGAITLGASVGTSSDKPPKIYISAEGENTKTALIGSYSWKYHNKNINADSDHPVNFKYELDNIVNTTAKQQIVISTQKLKLDKKYDFTIEQISVYKAGQIIAFKAEPSFMNGNLYLQSPPDSGEYIYCLILNFKEKGIVNYGFVVRNDMITYNLSEISKHKTLYVGNNSKDSAIVRNLPVPDRYFKQQYISLETKNRPYKINIFYEANNNASHSSEWPIVSTINNATYSNLFNNALVIFCMIDNVDEVTFLFRDSQSDGKLDESKYDKSFTFSRASVEEKYGDIKLMANDISLLQDALNGKIHVNKDVVSITTNKTGYSTFTSFVWSSMEGITMTPNFKSNKKYNKLEYHWTAEKGQFITQPGGDSEIEIRNHGEDIAWVPFEKDRVIDIENGPFNIQLDVIDGENQTILAKTKLIIYADKGVYEIK